MGKKQVFLRADGNSKIGLGHVIRCMALAEMLSSDFDCHFLIQNPSPALQKQILAQCTSLISLDETFDYEQEAALISDNYFDAASIVVLDGYQFKTAYQQSIKNTGARLVAIDDIYAHHFVADVIINHAGGLSPSHYSAETHTQFCLGLSYALLRQPFREAARMRTTKRSTENLFICLGGADPKNDTINILKACESNGAISHCFVVLGSAYRHQEALQNFLENSSLEVTLLTDLSAEEMRDYMLKCARAITPPSTISYEYLSVGGELYLQLTAENQRNIYEYLLSSGLAFSFDHFVLEDRALVEQAHDKQAQLLDGKAEERMQEVFNTLTFYKPK